MKRCAVCLVALCILSLQSVVGAAEEILTTSVHPFWVTNRDADFDGNPGGWCMARDMRLGDRVLLSDGQEVVLKTKQNTGAHPATNQEQPSVEKIHPTSWTTYNFSVADWQTYFVGEMGAYVHNTSTERCPGRLVTGLPLRKVVRSLRLEHADRKTKEIFLSYEVAHEVIKRPKGFEVALVPKAHVHKTPDVALLNPMPGGRHIMVEVKTNVFLTHREGIEMFIEQLFSSQKQFRAMSRITKDADVWNRARRRLIVQVEAPLDGSFLESLSFTHHRLAEKMPFSFTSTRGIEVRMFTPRGKPLYIGPFVPEQIIAYQEYLKWGVWPDLDEYGRVITKSWCPQGGVR